MRKAQQGFTLIEIIAVLVILGILAAVAVPKFLDLQTQARIKSYENLVAACQSVLSMKYAENLLIENGDVDDAWTAMAGNATNLCQANIVLDGYDDVEAGDIAVSGATDLTITVTGDSGSASGTLTDPR